MHHMYMWPHHDKCFMYIDIIIVHSQTPVSVCTCYTLSPLTFLPFSLPLTTYTFSPSLILPLTTLLPSSFSLATQTPPESLHGLLDHSFPSLFLFLTTHPFPLLLYIQYVPYSLIPTCIM